MTFAALIIGAYVLWAGLMIWAHPSLIYPFFPDRTDLPGFRQETLTADDGTEIAVQVSEGQGPTILYFMGNAGALQAFGGPLAQYRARGHRIVALEYRGGAGRPGRASETVLKSDALAAASHAASHGDPVVLHGYSLGTGLALHVASERAVAGVILEAPYSRLCTLMARAALLPACAMPMVQKWNSLAIAPSVTAPVLILHGENDRLIPPQSSVALDNALPRSRRLIIEGADHLDIGLRPDTWREIDGFLTDLGP